MKLNVNAFALTLGAWWAVSMFFMTWWFIGRFGVDETVAPSMLERIYIGYRITPFGSLVGLAWGFISGAVFGGMFAWLYNFFVENMGAVKTEPAVQAKPTKRSARSTQSTQAKRTKRSTRSRR